MSNIRLKRAKSFEELKRGITAQNPREPEVIPWVWFDTQTYTDNTTTTLTFFNTLQTDKVLGNMEAAGQIPAPMYFDLYHLGIHFHMPPQAINTASATAVATGVIQDLAALSLGEVELSIAQKVYYKDKIYSCPSGAGVNPFIAGVGTYTAQASSEWQFATLGNPDLRNRNNFFGMLTIPHNQNFRVDLNWTAAIDLLADVKISVRLDGYLYRRVL